MSNKDIVIKALVALVIKGARYFMVVHGGMELTGDSAAKLEGAVTILGGLAWSFGEDIYKAKQAQKQIAAAVANESGQVKNNTTNT